MNVEKAARQLGLDADQARRVSVMVMTAGLPFDEAVESVRRPPVQGPPITSPSKVIPPPPGVEVRAYRRRGDMQADAHKRMAAGWRIGAQTEGVKTVAGWSVGNHITVTWVRP